MRQDNIKIFGHITMRKKAMISIAAILLLFFFACIIGSSLLFGSRAWIDHSFSYLGTYFRSEIYFSFMLSMVALWNLLLQTLIVQGYIEQGVHVVRRREFAMVWLYFLLSHLFLIVLAWVPLHQNWFIHWSLGSLAVFFYFVAILVLSRLIGGTAGRAIGILMGILLAGSGVVWFLTGTILFSEVIIVMVVFLWNFLLIWDLCPDMRLYWSFLPSGRWIIGKK
jgi:hypothetical protein